MGNCFIVSIDQSTQSTKAIIMDENGNVVAEGGVPHRQIIDDMGHVEHNPEEIVANLKKLLEKLVFGIDKRKIIGVGIGNQRETVAVWNRKTGKPVCNAIVWQCNRALSVSNRLEAQGLGDLIRQVTGLKLSPFFSAPKITWILENIPGAREAASAGELCCGTMDSWVIFNLTGGKSHRTDFSNASRMMLMDLKKLRWSEKMCDYFEIPMSMLPEICDSDALFGYTDLFGLLDKPVPIHAAAGDSHASLYGMGCFEKGTSMTGYGTGSCVMMNIGSEPVLSSHELLTSVAWKTSGAVKYAYDGVINYSGAVVTWLLKDLELIKNPSETDALARMANPSDKTVLVPAFSGIGAPYWSTTANAVIYGMSRTTKKAELCKAAIESIGYQVGAVVMAMEKDCRQKLDFMVASGGPAKNPYLMQFQSDIIDSDVLAAKGDEMTCRGAAFMCGVAMGVIDKSVIEKSNICIRYSPTMSQEERDDRISRWEAAVNRVLNT